MKVAVVYLFREPDEVHKFFNSYFAHRSGHPHELVILSKGDAILPYEYAVMPHKERFSSDIFKSLSSYRQTAASLDTAYVCFLNSYSVIQQDRWLDILMSQATKPSVGMAGATGSYESFRAASQTAANQRLFLDFPNPHLRTNAIVIRRDLVLYTFPRFAFTKHQEHLAESGLNRITHKVRRLGFNPVVVGANGRPYSTDEWEASCTFRSGNQQNLPVTDNQTREYQDASPNESQRLHDITWGTNHAEPI